MPELLDGPRRSDRMRRIDAPHCPACGQVGPVAHHGVRDHWFGTTGDWDLRRCDECRSLWLDPRPHPDDLHLAYRSYYTHGEAVPDAGNLKRILTTLPSHRDDRAGAAAWLGTTPPGRALDVGCGDGRTMDALRAVGWDVIGLDPDPDAVAACRARGLDARVGMIDAADGLGRFDAVVALHVIEHVDEPGRLLAAARASLRPGGHLVVVTPNAAGVRAAADGPWWRGLEAPRHLQILTAAALSRLAAEAGFTSLRTFSSVRGTNGLVRAARQARRGTTTTSAADLVAGELGQLAAWAAWRRAPGRGDELCLMAVNPG